MATQPRLTFTLLVSGCEARRRAVAMATPLLCRLMFMDNNGNVVFLFFLSDKRMVLVKYVAVTLTTTLLQFF